MFSVTPISARALQEKLAQHEDFLLLDVREAHEYAYAHIEPSVLIPLQQIPARLTEIDAQREVVVLCHHGMRSQQAAEYLVRNGVQRVFNLTGGIDAWSTQCDPSVPRY
jgi:rhodanese-related sulfurtransferase